MKYPNVETKVLDVEVEPLIARMRGIGAKEVFDAERTITHLDDGTGRLRAKNLKLTEEDKLKLSIDTNEEHSTVKLFVSRKGECIDMFAELGIHPIAVTRARRTSFEWEGVDFDIDQFPGIPPFLEVDVAESAHTLEEVLATLELEEKEQGMYSTPQIYERYGLNYFEHFKAA